MNTYLKVIQLIVIICDINNHMLTNGLLHLGNMAAFDMADPTAVVSPGGVGFDINCGVRLLRTNLFEADVLPVKEQLTQSMFDHIPVGVGSKGVIPMQAKYDVY